MWLFKFHKKIWQQNFSFFFYEYGLVPPSSAKLKELYQVEITDIVQS